MFGGLPAWWPGRAPGSASITFDLHEPTLFPTKPGPRKRVDYRDRVRAGGLGLVKSMPTFSDVDGTASGGHIGL